MPTRFWTAMAGLLGLCGVALGAVAAHAVADAHAAQMLSQAAAYQIMHAVALLALSLMPGTLPARGAGANCPGSTAAWRWHDSRNSC